MTLAFRNITADPQDPVETWPTEAVDIALARGDIDAWRRLVAVVDRDPWGRTARQIEEVLSHSRPYGVAELLERAIETARREAEEAERQTVAARVRHAIEASGLTQAEFASRVGTSNSRLSTYATGKVTPSAAMMLRIEQLAPSAE